MIRFCTTCPLEIPTLSSLMCEITIFRRYILCIKKSVSWRTNTKFLPFHISNLNTLYGPQKILCLQIANYNKPSNFNEKKKKEKDFPFPYSPSKPLEKYNEYNLWLIRGEKEHAMVLIWFSWKYLQYHGLFEKS